MEKKYLDMLEKNTDLLNLFGLKLSELGDSIYLTKDNVSTLYHLNTNEFSNRTVLNSVSDKTTLDIEMSNSTPTNVLYISLSDFYNTEYALRCDDKTSIELLKNDGTARVSLSIGKDEFEYKYNDSKRKAHFIFNSNIDERYTTILEFSCQNQGDKCFKDECYSEECYDKLYVKNGHLYYQSNNKKVELPYLLKDKYIYDYLSNRYTIEELYFVISYLTTNCPNIINFLKNYPIFDKISKCTLNLSLKQKLYLMVNKNRNDYRTLLTSKTLKKDKK